MTTSGRICGGKGVMKIGKTIFLMMALTLVISSLSSAATVSRRSVRQSSGNGNGNAVEECHTNGICGWQVYNPSTRLHVRHVAATCKCNKKDVCMRAEDDIGVPAYVYRCASRRSRTTQRPETSTTRYTS